MLQQKGPNGTSVRNDCHRHIPTERTRPQHLNGSAGRLPHPLDCLIVDVHERFRVDFGYAAALVEFCWIGFPIDLIARTLAGPVVARNLRTAEFAIMDRFGRTRIRGSLQLNSPAPDRNHHYATNRQP